MRRVVDTARPTLAIAVLLASRLAAADPVTVKVVELAAGVAYVEPGRAAGVVPGTTVRFGTRELTVIEASDKTAVVKLDQGSLAIGDAGVVDLTASQAGTAGKKLAPPQPLSTWKEQWAPPVMPATLEHPDPVPLGAAAVVSRPAHVTVIGHGYGALDATGVDAEGEARVISSFDVMRDRPFAVDADFALRGYTSGWNSKTNTPLFVYAAQARYGAADDPRVALGRLRYAATSVGMLDGGRASLRAGTFELAAFGGLVPDPVSGKPDTSASRFGVEAAYDDPKSAWQPRAGVTAYGSTWMGAIDERRLSAFASASHASTFVTGWADVQSFAAGNPFGASALELTGAGASGEWRKNGVHAGFDVTFLRPEQSLRLLATLPPEWLCTRVAQRGDVPNEACQSGDYWLAASGSAGMRRGAWTIDGVGSIGTTHTDTRTVDMSGYLRGEYRFGTHRLELAASSGRASFVRYISTEVGVGIAPSRRLDVMLRYRPELLDYRAGTEPYFLHSISTDLRYSYSTALDLGLSALATTGADRDAIVLLTTVAWRPLP